MIASDNADPAIAGLVSVIMPTYNRGHLLGGAVDSVARQSYPHWELLVIDDASADDTAARLARYGAAEPRIRLLRNRVNRGAPFCRNLGLRAARGEWINFLDSDDELAADKLAKQTARLRADPRLDVAVAASLRRTPGKSPVLLDAIEPSSDAALPYEFIAKRIAWKIHAPLWKKRFLTAQPGFDEGLASCQDYEYYARAVLRRPRAYYSAEPLALINDFAAADDAVKIRRSRSTVAQLADRIQSRRLVRRQLAAAPPPALSRLRIEWFLCRYQLSCLYRAAASSRRDGYRLLRWYVGARRDAF